MDFGVTFQTDPPASRVVELTQRAEGLGFTHAWTFDSHILWQEPYVIYSQMLAATERIVVGPFVTNPATRDPTVTGSLFATLNDMFGNRTVCGIGRGDSSRRVLGRPPTTLAETEEAMHIIKELAEGRAIETPAGEVKIPWVRDGRLEVWMAAYGPKALALCGRKADGFILQLADPDITRWTVAKVREAAVEAGRDPDAITVCVAAPAYIGDDLAHAREQCRWFGGMVGNHVADIVKRYGEGGDIPTRADRLHQGPRGLRLLTPRARGQPRHRVRARRDRRALLRAGHRRGPRGQAARARGPGRRPVQHLPHARRAGRDARRPTAATSSRR